MLNKEGRMDGREGGREGGRKDGRKEKWGGKCWKNISIEISQINYKPGQARPNETKPSQAKPSQGKARQGKARQGKPSQAKPSIKLDSLVCFGCTVVVPRVSPTFSCGGVML